MVGLNTAEAVDIGTNLEGLAFLEMKSQYRRSSRHRYLATTNMVAQDLVSIPPKQ